MARVNYKDILDKLLMVWTVCYGTITLQTAAGYFLSHVWLPYVGFALIVFIIWFGYHNLSTSSLNCSLMTHYTVYTLGVSGVIMLVANLLNTNLITNAYSEFSQENYPFHVSFIIYPVATVFYAIGIFRQSHPEYCTACKEMAAFSIKESLRRNVLHNEAKVHLYLAFGISLFLSAVTYAYYFIFYRSDNISRLHTPDIFFMYIFPVATYAVSVLYLFTKYAGQHFEISINEKFDDNKRSTRLRFLVIWNDKILLNETVYDEFGSTMWDTAVQRQMDFYEGIPLEKVKDIFIDMTGAEHFEMRRLFSSNSKLHNINHYSVVLPDDNGELPKIKGQWFTLQEISTIMQAGMVSRTFAMEMKRIHVITMAWKTYDRAGNRLYPVKNYRPSFRLKDFKRWNVDYEDLHWINVAQNNQDKPFFKLRKIWRKYITGVENRWDGKNS